MTRVRLNKEPMQPIQIRFSNAAGKD